MIVGETIQIYQVEEFVVPTIITSATVRIIDPVGNAYTLAVYADGVLLSGSSGSLSGNALITGGLTGGQVTGGLGATSGSGGGSTSSALSHTLSCYYTPLYAGIHTATWSFNDTNETITSPQEYFCAWTDIYRFMRRKMSKTRLQLPDADIDAEMSTVVRSLFDAFPVLGTYYGLSGTDKVRFDEGAALLACLSMRAYKPNMSANTDLISWKIQTTEMKFAQAKPSSEAESLEDIWTRQAYQALYKITAIAALYKQKKADFGLMRLSGPTRTRKKNGQLPSLYSVIADLVSDTAPISGSELLILE